MPKHPHRPLALTALLFSGILLGSACGEGPSKLDASGMLGRAELRDPGALIRLEMRSTVGVLLDDIPSGPLRDAAAADALAKGASFWEARAKHQVRLTYYRLVFRSLYYASAWSSTSKVRGPLPLPPKSTWTIGLNGQPRRDTSSGHDIVTVDYTFNAMIVTDAVSPGQVEPRLATIGGTWDEAFSLPIDPELLLQRTGYACMDEDEYPPGSVFEENTWYFYDDTCKAGSQGCHLWHFPQESCVEAVQKHSGVVKPAIHFTRLPYDKKTADTFRVGAITNPNGVDLAVVQEGLEQERRVVYRYFEPGSCELEEHVIDKLGWRRLMMFSAVVQNNGTQRLHIGDLSDPTNPWLTSHVFEFSPCHGHYHFSHYGTFGYNGAPGSKRAFCLEDTNRFHNDEATPLTAEHQSCSYQGIGAGWGDEYEFGIPGQWVDVTDVDTVGTHDLTFLSNPDAFLCEGQPVLDGKGNPIFDPTTFTDEQGETVSRERCDMPSGWADNNLGSTPVSAPAGSFVTDPCTDGQIGPLRDCGFSAQHILHACVAGTTVTLTCSNSGPAQVLRLCERSAVLGVGVACTLTDAVANQIVDGPTVVSFTCPTVRDAPASGGYASYDAPVLPSQTGGSVSCTGW